MCFALALACIYLSYSVFSGFHVVYVSRIYFKALQSRVSILIKQNEELQRGMVDVLDAVSVHYCEIVKRLGKSASTEIPGKTLRT